MRALLRLYPKPWRERYGDEFELVLQAYAQGPGGALDVVRGALDAHLRGLRPGALRRWALLLIGCGLVGWLNFHAADDVQPVALALLLFGLALGLQARSHGWLWALLLFAAVPVSGAWADAVSYHPGVAKPAPLYESIIALIPALLGTYAGVVIRWSTRRAPR